MCLQVLLPDQKVRLQIASATADAQQRQLRHQPQVIFPAILLFLSIRFWPSQFAIALPEDCLLAEGSAQVPLLVHS